MRSRIFRATRCIQSEHITSPARPSWIGHRCYATSQRQWSTPLAKTLAEAITTTGPIPVASFMRQCLTSDLGGYYTTGSPDRDQFGRKGDFVTSPEISQIFGELVGLWIVAEWIAQGRRSEGVYLMEVGPGRGTLMDDVLRTIRNFKDLVSALDCIYLVEASPSLREAQHKLLCGDAPLTTSDIGFQSHSKYNKDMRIVWVEDIRLLPKENDRTPFILAHEFFDALPIHVFQSIPPKIGSAQPIQTPTGPVTLNKPPESAQKHQWREMLVSPTSPFATHDSLGTPKSQRTEPVPEFQLTLSKAATRHSMYLTETSARYRNLKDTSYATIEVSPESQTYATEFAVRIGGGRLPGGARDQAGTAPSPTTPSQPDHLHRPQPSGAALIIDYGPPDTIPSNSLRGVKAHRRVSPFLEAGRVDVSADVDFLALAEAAVGGSEGVEVHGPVSQAAFLTGMGIEQRAAQLVRKAMDAERGGGKEWKREDLTETVKRIESGWKRLVERGPHGMGKLYQVMAILPYTPRGPQDPIRRPVGFGGDISL